VRDHLESQPIRHQHTLMAVVEVLVDHQALLEVLVL
jgi:hypothetical protein